MESEREKSFFMVEKLTISTSNTRKTRERGRVSGWDIRISEAKIKPLKIVNKTSSLSLNTKNKIRPERQKVFNYF